MVPKLQQILWEIGWIITSGASFHSFLLILFLTCSTVATKYAYKFSKGCAQRFPSYITCYVGLQIVTNLWQAVTFITHSWHLVTFRWQMWHIVTKVWHSHICIWIISRGHVYESINQSMNEWKFWLSPGLIKNESLINQRTHNNGTRVEDWRDSRTLQGLSHRNVSFKSLVYKLRFFNPSWRIWPLPDYWKILLDCRHVFLLFERLVLCLITYTFSAGTLSLDNWTRLTSRHCP